MVETEIIEASVIEVSEVVRTEASDASIRAPRVVIDLRPGAGSDASDAAADPAPGHRAAPVGAAAGSMRGRIAVVTGGASGVGRAIALRLAAAGARVCVVGRDVARLRETVELAGPDAAVLFLQCDVGSVSEIEGVVDFIDRFDRPVDILVHAEGVQVRGGVEHGSVSDLDEQYLINVRGPYLISQKLLDRVRAGQGHVVFINASASTSNVEMGQFSVTNSGLRALADTLRSEVREAGVRVTTVYPEISTGGTGEPSLAVDPDDIAATVVHAVDQASRVEVTDIHLRAVSGPGRP